jgi:hypothetical protein
MTGTVSPEIADGSGAAGRVPAVGGTRTVPAPDPVAREYLLLGLRLDQHLPGLVDGYFGPADLKARVDMEQLRSPGRLRDDAAGLRDRLRTDVTDAGRAAWLDAQLVALQTHAAALAGQQLPYLEHLARCFAFTPRRRPDDEFTTAAATIDELLPGDQPLTDRLARWDDRFVVALDRLPGVVDWLVGLFRARSAELFRLPDGEDLRVSLVNGQPWAAYNWYDGGRRSRIDINTDLPARAWDLVDTVAHETYPGHHLEHASKETSLVDGAGRVEASLLLINTPECLITEGLANVGLRFVAPPEERTDLLIELYQRAGLPIAADPVASRDAADRTVVLAGARARLAAVRGNAAILRHADGRSHDEVLDYLREVGRTTPDVAAKRLDFIEHPLWRTYVFVYGDGEELVDAWLDAVPAPERPGRFGRLLHEALTLAELTANG